MPPKVKVSKDDIVEAAFTIVRKDGIDAMNARAIASALNCSTQPIFSNFGSIDELRIAVVERTDRFFHELLRTEIEREEYPPYKATGMAYIKFAKDEKELFKLLYMRDRTDEVTDGTSKVDELIGPIVRDATGLGRDDAALFHLEVWSFVHGIATMFATGFLDMDMGLVSRMMTDSYQGLRKQHGLD